MPSRSPSASAASARPWSGPPPRSWPTTTWSRATTSDFAPARRKAPCRCDGLALAGPFAFRPRVPPRGIRCRPAGARVGSLDELRRARADPGARARGRGRPGVHARLEQAASYLPPDQLSVLRRAWAVGAAAHEGQMRKSGEPYITHPVAVAAVLAEQKVDIETLVAAVLHDTIEDTPLTRAALASEFGEAVAELVEGVTKLDKLRFASRREADAESFRKMMLAMARDLRVIL